MYNQFKFPRILKNFNVFSYLSNISRIKVSNAPRHQFHFEVFEFSYFQGYILCFEILANFGEVWEKIELMRTC